MGKNINVFRTSEENTFAVSNLVFDKLLRSPDFKPSTMLFYLYLLRQANQPLVRLHTPTVAEATGMHRATIRTATQALLKLDLLRIPEDAESAKGFILYELLGENGGKLPTPDDWIVFRELDDEIVEAYYADRLGVRKAPHHDNDWLGFACPFCVHSPNKNPFRVTLKRGGEFHGMYLCGQRGCGKKGGMVQLERELAAKHGQPITVQQASSIVRSFLTSRMVGDDLVHPALREMMKPHPDGVKAI